MSLVAYECLTAEDARQVAARCRAWRKKMFAAPKAPPSAEPEVFYLCPTVPLETAISSAYPKAYCERRGREHVVTLGHPPTIAMVIRAVCEAYRCTQQDLLSDRRTKSIMLPRHVCMALAKRLTRKSLPEIGRKMGDRDHTTILHAVRKMQPVIDAANDRFRLMGAATLGEWVTACKGYAENKED